MRGGDRALRVAAAVVVVAVAGFAAVVSYTHIHELVRRARQPDPAGAAEVPRSVEQAVLAAYRASVVAGSPLSQRAMAERFGVSRRKVSQLITSATATSNRRPAGTIAPRTPAGPLRSSGEAETGSVSSPGLLRSAPAD